ncbi:hypothetical protein Desor_0102 [Desulfosporosinus orientis DSM 765]|uniref:Uncharacterized protein n=1 Tax=Desulfosporosinus orientis (strain ATCC 19365 / DSM 765 / NCIMB 8382 / VKM B-1628 / Singapore I) TaxID=768706 RepID=G7W4Y3_DESOD|nr:hypothetical protein Desor_0102 [Desulfosporosinus orientis DSM 765]
MLASLYSSKRKPTYYGEASFNTTLYSHQNIEGK